MLLLLSGEAAKISMVCVPLLQLHLTFTLVSKGDFQCAGCCVLYGSDMSLPPRVKKAGCRILGRIKSSVLPKAGILSTTSSTAAFTDICLCQTRELTSLPTKQPVSVWTVPVWGAVLTLNQSLPTWISHRWFHLTQQSTTTVSPFFCRDGVMLDFDRQVPACISPAPNRLVSLR